MKKLCSLLTAMILCAALLLPAGSLAEDSRRWVEDVTKLHALPLADTQRLDAAFSRLPIANAADAAASALNWAHTDALHPLGTSRNDFSLFVMGDASTWHVTLCSGDSTLFMTLDAEGRLLALVNPDTGALPAYEGVLPEGMDAALLSYIEHFAHLNGCSTVTDYARIGCTAADSAYDVRITASALLDGTPCEFTISLATMAFTALSCPLPAAAPVPSATISPNGVEQFTVTIGEETVVVEAIDKRTLGSAFSPWPSDAMPREEVFAIALQALMDDFGLTIADLTAEPFEYGYDMESAMHIWQLDFSSLTEPTDGMEYTVHVRDSDGAVTGTWGPSEANG